jgi:hypothetical protein
MHTLPNLPAAVAREVFATLCGSLPPPVIDTPETRADRDDTAMAAVAALHPTDAFEAKLAADIVAADASVMDCHRLAAQHGSDLAATLRCRAQATATMRQMRSLLRDYQRMQAEREKAEAAMHPAAMERAGWWFRDASVPLPAEEPESVLGEGGGTAQGEAARPDAPQQGAARPAAAPPDPVRAQPAFCDLSEAEQYAVIYPERAARIRAHGGLPVRLDFGPPEPEIVDALVNGTSPILRALDHRLQEAAAA